MRFASRYAGGRTPNFSAMDLLEAGTALDAALISHYQLVAPIMEQLFGPIPLVWAAYPLGTDRDPQYHAHYFGHWTKLSAQHIERLVKIGAREFYSWSPTPDDPARCRFARLLLNVMPGTDASCVKDAATALRTLLKEEGRDAIPVLDGLGNMALWVPLADGPAYEQVRIWAHALAARAVQEYGEILSTAFNTKEDGRIHLHVSSNAVDRWSILPYSYRAKSGRIAIPISWDELQACDVLGTPLAEFSARLWHGGDVFAELLRSIPSKPCHAELVEAHTELTTCHPELVEAPQPCHPELVEGAHKPTSRADVLNEATQILWDGKPRTAQQLLDEGDAKGYFGPYTEPMLKSHLIDYINRTHGRGLEPSIVLDADGTFRINEPLDLWPSTIPAQPAPTIDIDALIARLHKTSNDGTLSEQFEQAVCDAFTALGFVSTHVGGRAAPDGYADAPLGTMGYRVMIECKAGTPSAGNPNIYEAAKYKDAFHGQYCIIVGDGIGHSQREVIDEMRTHGVALWDVADIASALQHGFMPAELEPAFGPGVMAEDKLVDLLWARDHGQAKRVRIIAEIVRSAGWTTQYAAAQANSPADAPLLTEDAAMLLVDQELAAQGAHVNCTREEVRLAFEWLTNPLNGAAVWNPDKTAIVIVTPKEN